MADEPIPGAAPAAGDTPVVPAAEPAAAPAATVLGDPPTESWLDSVPEAHREALKGYDSWEKLVEAANKPAPVVPDEYKAPEGVEIDAETFKAFQPLAKELGMTQEAVDKLLAFDNERMNKLPELIMKKSADQLAEANKKMAEELGQEKYDATVANARLAMKSFADPEVIKWLNETGQGNNPILIKLFASVGAKLAEDVPPGGADGTPKADTASVLFPDMKK